MSAELVIMAAGLGSRYGGLKQAAPLGPNGEMIIDFSVYDAAEAGFDRAVIIIRPDIEKDFRELCGKRIVQEGKIVGINHNAGVAVSRTGRCNAGIFDVGHLKSFFGN